MFTLEVHDVHCDESIALKSVETLVVVCQTSSNCSHFVPLPVIFSKNGSVRRVSGWFAVGLVWRAWRVGRDVALVLQVEHPVVELEGVFGRAVCCNRAH